VNDVNDVPVKKLSLNSIDFVKLQTLLDKINFNDGSYNINTTKTFLTLLTQLSAIKNGPLNQILKPIFKIFMTQQFLMIF
jgi:hypothetical protein